MRKRFLKQLSRVGNIRPNKVLRRQRFLQRSKAKQQHPDRYGDYTYNKAPKPGQFNRWQNYKRLNNRYF